MLFADSSGGHIFFLVRAKTEYVWTPLSLYVMGSRSHLGFQARPITFDFEAQEKRRVNTRRRDAVLFKPSRERAVQ